jgi:AcrR family transcriptional regulator
MASTRRVQTRGSQSRTRLIEAAYDLLAEEGYQAFSARRVAQKAGLKPQLVHYHFRSMEELIVAVFQRSCANHFALHDEALSSRHPLRAMWALNSSLPEGKRVTEFIALSKVYPALREAMREAGESFRRLQIEAVERLFVKRGLDHAIMGPRALVALLAALARNVVIESEVNLSMAHEELHELIGRILNRYDPLGTDEFADGDGDAALPLRQ